MRNELLVALWFPIFCFSCSELFAQNVARNAFLNGFEQVVVTERTDSLWIGFEHRNFRSPGQSILFLLRSDSLPVKKDLVFIPRYYTIPLGAYDLSKNTFDPRRGASGPGSSAAGDVSGYRVHLRVSPDIQARFGNFDNPIQAKINLLIDAKVFLGYGFAVYSGVQLPLTNSLDTQASNVRPGPTQLQYFGKIAPGHFVFLSAGSFFYDRYGLDLQYRKYDFTSRLSFGLEAGLTGFYFFPPEGLYTRSMNDVYALLDLEYFIPRLSSSVGLSLGQFLFQDRGLRIDLVRQYGNLDIGFFAIGSENGFNGGFNLAFPLFPGKLLRTKWFELRTNEDFRWEYGVNNEDLVGRRYRTGTTRLKDFLRPYHSQFITQQISSSF